MINLNISYRESSLLMPRDRYSPLSPECVDHALSEKGPALCSFFHQEIGLDQFTRQGREIIRPDEVSQRSTCRGRINVMGAVARLQIVEMDSSEVQTEAGGARCIGGCG